jgi:hypothetical protein
METLDYARGWLRGFFDGEGGIAAPIGRVSMSNTEASMIAAATRYLAMFGIVPRMYTQTRKPHLPIMRLVISRRADVRTFIREIGSGIPRKRALMDEVLAYYDRPGQRRSRAYGPPAPTKEHLTELVERGLRDYEIGPELGLKTSSVVYYKMRFGLCKDRRRGPEPDPEDVRRGYWDEGLSLTQLSARFGYKGNSIAPFMRRHGIPRRGVGLQPK